MNNNYNSCVEGCSLPSTPNDMKILLDQIKTYLSNLYNEGKPLEVYYITTTDPQYIDLPDETQEILNNIKTYKNISNISVDGIGSLKVVYHKDLETLYKNQEARLLALESAMIE